MISNIVLQMKKNIVIIIVVAIFAACESLPEKQVNNCYWFVGNHVEFWREWHDPQFKTNHITKTKLINSDTATFEIIDNPYSSTCYAKDKNQVYMNRTIIMGADPNTFTFLGGFYARDKYQVFNSNKLLKYANAETFDVFKFNFKNNNYLRTVVDAKDDKCLYNNGYQQGFSKIVDIKTFEPVNQYFFKDKNHIYRGFDPGKPVNEDLFIINEADINSFELINDEDGFYAKDSSHVYINCYGNKFFVFTPDNIASFKVLNVRYSKDAQNVYYYGEKLEDADVESFEKDGAHGGKDKNGLWNASGKLENIK